MFVPIEPNNGLAIYDQVVRQIKFGIARRHLRPGELVPSVRELSRQLAINPNTVARAYRQLQDEGILAAVRGLGMQVTTTAPTHCKTERRQLIGDRLRDVIQEARQSGLGDDEISQMIERARGTTQ